MASTVPPIVALDYSKIFIKKMPLEQVFLKLANRIAYMMWMYAPWRWTIGSTPQFTLVAGQQNYTIAYPADFLYALDAAITNGQLNENNLKIIPSIETTSNLIGNPTAIAYMGNAGDMAGLVRIQPVPAQLPASPPQVINGLYKKTMTAFTARTIYTGVMPFPDEWFWVFEEGVLWASYLYADDRRAGDASMDPKSGKINFSGQRAVFEAGLERMRTREPLLLTDPQNVDQKEWDK